MRSITSLSLSNPFVVLVTVIILITIVLSILRSMNMTIGFGVNAHLGRLRGSFSVEGFEGAGDKEGPALIMFYADWCGHCKRAKPELERARDRYRGPVKIIFMDGDAKENAGLLKQEGVQGFPTIRYYPGGIPMMGQKGEFKEYSGDRKEEAFVEYLNTL